MFKSAKRALICATGLVIFLSGFTLLGQITSEDPQKVQQKANVSFKANDFRMALTGFRKLMESEPKNAMHRYHTGVCLVELNEHLDEAIELLYGASTRGVPHNVNYYLAMAYQRNYNFNDALKYFGRFELKASRQELKEYNIKHLMGTCRSAKEITATYNPYEVMNVTFIDLFDSLQFSQVKMKGGQLQRKPSAYFTDNEKTDGLTSLMFDPPNAIRGDYLYFSGYNRNGKGGAQLFRVKKGSGRSMSDPQEIKSLNTEGNEIMPYFDPIEDDLYFASDGHMGIGGFDLYRSHFDSERDQWSEPMNLGFPVNSVMDEYLLLPGSDLGMVMFFSTRQGTDSTVTVYRVHLVEPKKKTMVNDFAMLQEIALMGGVAGDILAELEDLETVEESAVSLERVAQQQREDNTKEPVITPVTILPDSRSKSTYQLTLSEALRHQVVSDSLKDLATDARVRVRESDDPNDRWVWQKQIMLWEKKAHDEEEIADDLYAQLEEEREVDRQTASVNVPETIQVDTIINDLTVYRYTTSTSGIEGEPGTPSEQTYSPPVLTSSPPVQAEKSTELQMNRFDILRQSPYGIDNPIPLDMALPGGTFYRIQLGAFSSEVEPDAFRGISPITGERILERGLIKYYAGKFSNYDDASTALSLVRSDGYDDAFIVAWYNGNPVSTQKAKQLE